MTDEPRVYRAPLSQFRQLPDNPNAGSERGEYMLGESVSEFGAGRSMLAGSDDVLIAGNHAAERLHEQLGDEAIVVEIDGSMPVIVKRTDVAGDSPRGREMAVADNRTTEAGLAWDAGVMALMQEAGDIDLERWFREDELDEMAAISEYLEVAGNPIDSSITRNNNNLSRAGEPSGIVVPFSFGELSCLIPTEIYNDLLTFLRRCNNTRDGLIELMQYALENINS
jgi:hypothetical protein